MAMEAGPRNTAPGNTQHPARPGRGPLPSPGHPAPPATAAQTPATPPGDAPVPPRPPSHPDGPPDDGLSPDGPADGDEDPEQDTLAAPEVEVELRPQRRLRIWQLAPIVGLAVVGSLMFAFPLAFEFGDSGAVVAMLGLLICSCAAGWGLMAARRVGHTWPGLPQRGSGQRPDWRVVAAYVLVLAAVVVLAVLRVARLR
ncbi:hypothetical protein [Streptomyces sp. NPDC050560]|uniref:hypothetical protein n=1 Tax=Streptomyces sp. NPDC050560 TaxID=3365630 RepID=UPI0037B5243D